MSNATATLPSTSTNALPDAKAERVKNQAINGDKALVKVTGNTYPLKGWFYVLGGLWNKADGCWMIPEHNAAAAQAKADELSKPKAPKSTTPAPAKPKATAPVKADKPAPVAAPTAPTNFQAAVKRIENLAKATGAIRNELSLQHKEAIEKGAPLEKIEDALATMDVVTEFLGKALVALA